MTKDLSTAQTIYTRLVALYKHHCYLYYVEDRPEISDDAFNQIVVEIKSLEEAFPSIKIDGKSALKVGYTPDGRLPKVRFNTPMLSMDNIFQIEEACDKLFPNILVLEPKVDGLACSLKYIGGVFAQAYTRGDGTEGEDITEAVRRLTSVPKVIPALSMGGIVHKLIQSVEIRGEVYINRFEFDTINAERRIENLPEYANTRNAAAGTIRALDYDMIARRQPRFIAYGIGEIDVDVSALKQTDLYHWLSGAGFETTGDYALECIGESSIKGYIEHYAPGAEGREALPFDIDGVVEKVNSIKAQQELGATARVPLWAYAYKYPSLSVTTDFNQVHWSISYTGAYTPVACLTPVHLGGVMVAKATLHNLSFIKNLNVHLGDRVEIQRGGEVIPKVMGVVKMNGGAEIVPPCTCRYCKNALTVIQDRPTCTNVKCPERVYLTIVEAVSRDRLNVVGIGEETVRELTQQRTAEESFDDCLGTTLSKDLELAPPVGSLYDLLDGRWIGRWRSIESSKQAQNFVATLEKLKSKPIDAWRIISTMFIPEVGKDTSKLLAKRYTPYELVERCRQDKEGMYTELMTIRGIGKVVANNIVTHLTNPELDLRWMDFFTIQQPPKANDFLAGKTYVITGSHDVWTREKLKEFIEQNGGRVSGTLSKSTTMLLTGTGGGGKRKKADALHVPTLTIDEFLALF